MPIAARNTPAAITPASQENGIPSACPRQGNPWITRRAIIHENPEIRGGFSATNTGSGRGTREKSALFLEKVYQPKRLPPLSATFRRPSSKNDRRCRIAGINDRAFFQENK